MKARKAPDPLDFYGHLRWLDGRPLTKTIEPYRARILREALFTFDADGRPTYNLVLSGRAKKNFKTSDLCLAMLYRFLVWPSPTGNDCIILANDQEQAGDDLSLIKKMVEVNPLLQREVQVKAKSIARTDGRGELEILPARDVAGAHGRTYLAAGFDEIHGYRSWDLFEALAPDPTRTDALTWITSYASIYNSPGAPLHDLLEAGKRGDDPRMFLSWYSAEYCTDPAFAELPTPEERANPSLPSWGNEDYLTQQRRRLPTHKYRRLHLNLPGAPEGAAFDGAAITDAIVAGRKRLPPEDGVRYHGFVDMSGGSSDDATLAIAHHDPDSGRLVIDCVEDQGRQPPFDPRMAVAKFADRLKEYRLGRVRGDSYAGETFKGDFEAAGIKYEKARSPKSDIYAACEPLLNAGEIELPDQPKLQDQLLTLVWRGRRIDHAPGDHDDWANAVCGALIEAKPKAKRERPQLPMPGGDKQANWAGGPGEQSFYYRTKQI